VESKEIKSIQKRKEKKDSRMLGTGQSLGVAETRMAEELVEKTKKKESGGTPATGGGGRGGGEERGGGGGEGGQGKNQTGTGGAGQYMGTMAVVLHS